jgi:hypothetical protein
MKPMVLSVILTLLAAVPAVRRESLPNQERGSGRR